jgi:predicted transcriptional regulator
MNAALARAKAAAAQLSEAMGENDGVRQLVADLAILEAHSLDKATTAAAKRRRTEALETARRELEAALASNPLLAHKIKPKLAELDSMGSLRSTDSGPR